MRRASEDEVASEGAGPRLHVHPYDETFIITVARGRFSIGDADIDAAAGAALIVGTAGVPHRFENHDRSAAMATLGKATAQLVRSCECES